MYAWKKLKLPEVGKGGLLKLSFFYGSHVDVIICVTKPRSISSSFDGTGFAPNSIKI